MSEQININRAKLGLPPLETSQIQAQGNTLNTLPISPELQQKVRERAAQKKEVNKPFDSGRSTIADVGVGVGKGALKTTVGSASLGQRGLTSFWKTVLPKAGERALGIENDPTLGWLKKSTDKKTSAEEVQAQVEQKRGLKPGQLTTPQNNAQKAGFYGEQIGEFFVPGGAATKVEKATQTASKLARIARVVAAETAIGTTQLGMQQGNIGANEVLGGTLGGLGAGAITALSRSGARAVKQSINPQVDYAIVKAEELMDKATRTSAQVQKTKFAKKAYGQTMNKFLVDEHIPVSMIEEGNARLMDGEAMMPIIQNKIDNFEKAYDSFFASQPQRVIKLSDVVKDAAKRIDDIALDSDVRLKMKDEFIKKTSAILEDRVAPGQKIINGKGEVVDVILNGQELRKMRTGWGKAKKGAFNNPGEYGALEQMYISAMNALETAYNSPLIKDMGQHYRKLLALQEAFDPALTTSLHRKALRGSTFAPLIQGATGQILGSVGGATVGAITGGPLGAMAGASVGPSIGKALFQKLASRNIDPARLSRNAIEGLRKAGHITKTDELLLRVANEIQNAKPKTKLLPTGVTREAMNGVIAPPYSAPTQYESRAQRVGNSTQYPEQKLLPQGTGMSGAPLIPPAPTIYEPPAKKIGNAYRPPRKTAKKKPVLPPNKVTQSIKKAKASGQSFDEWVKGQNLYHGTPNEIEGGALKFGVGKQLKKGGYMGGHFLTDTPEIAENFSFGGKVYHASGEIKNNVLDVNKNKKLFEDFIGKEYLSDGEKVKFTKQEFDYMFPNGKADWSTINTDLVEQVAKKQGKIGVAIPEYAGGKQGMTYQIFEDNIPVKTRSQLKAQWDAN